MALHIKLARDVVDRCIRETGNLPPPNDHAIEMQDILEKHNIITVLGVDELKTRIVGDSLGVLALDPPHKLDIEVLGDVKTTSSVGEIVALVAINSELVVSADLEVRAFDLDTLEITKATEAKGKPKKIKLTIKLEVEGEIQ